MDKTAKNNYFITQKSIKEAFINEKYWNLGKTSKELVVSFPGAAPITPQLC